MRTLASSRRSAAACLGTLVSLLASTASALPETSLMISEVFIDPAGGNNRRQWVELYNAGPTDIVLTGSYSLGFGRFDYTRTTVDLVGTILAGQTFIVGGDISDALNMNPLLDQAIDFAPTLQTGNNNNWADGIALFDFPAASIGILSDPIDTVIYGEATAAPYYLLTNQTGVSGSGTIGVVLPTSGITGQSIEFDGTSWQIQSTPTPGSSAAAPEPATGVLVALGLAGLAAYRRPRARSGPDAK